MEPNNSFHSSNSADTDILVKIPNNFFEPFEKSHFSNESEFIYELDNFLHIERHKELHNSTGNDALNYRSFKDTLQKDDDLNLQEEVLKRQHYEQLSTLLQKKNLQYEQKASFLSKVISQKDQVIQKLRKNEGLDEENSRLKLKIRNFEDEVNKTIQLMSKFQSKNEMLELKIENLTATSSEIREISKKQINDLEIRFSNSQLNVKELQDEIERLKVECKSEKENFIKEKHTRSLLDREVNSLKSQLKQAKDEKTRLLEKHEKEKQNAASKQKKVFSNMMEEFSEKERRLIKELDMQRMSLKNYYQAQLESALEAKVTEFQEKLEKFQEEIKEEADSRERHYTERAINQMELIVKKNEEEIDLILQKCSEEVELYKIQLLNATKTIESLETKLGEYQTRRHNIAENLHSIMEAQWKKTLEILTNPSKFSQSVEVDSNDFSETDNNHQHENVMNNLSRSEENLKSEMLRNYIDKLLKQSPKSEQVNEHKHDPKVYNKVWQTKPWK